MSQPRSSPMGSSSARQGARSPSSVLSWRSGSSSPPNTPGTSRTGRRPSSSSSSSSSSSLSPRRDLTGSWRATARPLPLNISSLPSFDEVKLGMVLHLSNPAPPESRIHQKLLAGGAQDPWNHPAVIVGKWIADGEQCVSIRLCTTFHGTRIVDYKTARHQKLYVLAANEEDEKPHGDTCLAEMEAGSGKFGRRTYVNLSANSVFPIEYKHLGLFGTKPPMRFDSKARDTIMNARED